ncbi:hypothetical protein AVEN_173678-1 [Araneus ventricosus]|uniref:Uncharacterized protein n=1 Tax=Araneus ventricosus TaxID=182803 RepID=A0A4Y2Q207_ARAVE|nr:hypothetical protein AVEN_173678-1 [Araneus ventricosus]
MVCISLTAGHSAAHRRWAQEHLRWGRAECSNVLFTDVSYFSVQSGNRRIIIWRARGTGNNPAFVHESAQFGGGGVIVWDSVSINARTDLYTRVGRKTLFFEIAILIGRKGFSLGSINRV